MFQLLLSSAYAASRPLLFLTQPCQRVGWGCKEAGREHSWDSWPHLTKGMFQAVWHLFSNKARGEAGQGGCCLGTGWALVGGWWAIVFNYITCLAWVLFLSLCFFFLIIFKYFPFNYIFYYYIFISIIKMFLSQPVSFLPFTLLILSPYPAGEEGASGCVVFSCWLGLNHASTFLVPNVGLKCLT